MINELIDIFKTNFPFIVREEKTVKEILGNKENYVIEKRNENRELIAVSVINKNTILMLCVNEEYRKQGIGSDLLEQSENYIKKSGFDKVVLGAGYDYVMPGVPTSKKYYDSENEKLYETIDDKASTFFEERGYIHSWDCNCFDMRFKLSEFKKNEYSIGDTINGITYRWASISDLEDICKCTEDAYDEFTQWYRDENLYNETNNQRVLVAVCNNQIVGTLIVSMETEGKNLGSVGCTTVKPSYRGQHIAVNLVILGTKYLKEIEMKEAYLGYTYTGLDHMYGYAGYKICVYYMMAKKQI